ncbi:MAG: hypothetical protein RLZZ31_555 [Actinomycetota bacterium]
MSPVGALHLGGANAFLPREHLRQTDAVDLSELSSATTTLDDLIERVSRVANEVLEAGDEGFAAELYEVERSLRMAHRRLQATMRRRK